MIARALFLILLMCAVGARAAEDFYAARVPVPDRTEAALGAAASSALEDVLVRMSGDETVPNLPKAAIAVADARNRMSLYSYEEADEGLVLYAQFDPGLVKDVLRQSGATYWGENRPPVLLWMVVDEPFSRRFATVSEDGELLKQLSTSFEERGVRLRLPLLDLEDAAALTPEMVWQKVTSRILAASARYGTQHVLVGRYVQLTSGQQIADWTYLDDDRRDSLQLQGPDAAPILAGAVDMVVDAMTDRYAIRLEPVSVIERIAVTVRGVETLSDYQSVVSVFKNISVLDGLQVAEVNGDQLRLSISGVGSAESLARLLPAASRLVVEGAPDAADLRLRWGQP